MAGSYGFAALNESQVIPAGYFAVVASGGPYAAGNVLAGTGVRHRGGAAVMQIKASGSYDVPTIRL